MSQEPTFLPTEPVATTGNPIEELVGEGKKYRSVEDLAKAYKNADQFIETLKTEKRTLEEQYHDAIAKNRSIEEIIEALNKQNEVVPPTIPATPASHTVS